MKRTESIRPIMSLLLAVLLSIGAVTNSYLQASEWGKVGTDVSIELKTQGAGSENPENSQQGEEAQLMTGHSFHAVITGTAELIAPNLPSPSPIPAKPTSVEAIHQSPSLCTPSLLEYYCNLRHYYIAPHAP